MAPDNPPAPPAPPGQRYLTILPCDPGTCQTCDSLRMAPGTTALVSADV
jgi:hypothetical protein